MRMDELVKELIPLLQYLIPGFVASWIFYTLTSFKRPDTFGQIVQALIFTFFIHGVVAGIGGLLIYIGKAWVVWGLWDQKAVAIWSAVIAILLGLFACFLVNKGYLHAILRFVGITVKTSCPNEWFSAFNRYKRFVVLHLKDDRRIYGWPEEWPSEPYSGQFVILDPAWLDEEGKEYPLGVEAFVIDATQVQWAELSTKTW